jgi:hypothetical protein
MGSIGSWRSGGLLGYDSDQWAPPRCPLNVMRRSICENHSDIGYNVTINEYLLFCSFCAYMRNVRSEHGGISSDRRGCISLDWYDRVEVECLPQCVRRFVVHGISVVVYSIERVRLHSEIGSAIEIPTVIDSVADTFPIRKLSKFDAQFKSKWNRSVCSRVN